MALRAARNALLWAAVAFVAGAAAGSAQTVPDAGQLLRENERQRLPPPPTSVPQPTPAAPIKRPANETPFVVHRFRLTGITLVPEADVQAVLVPYLHREI